MPYQGLADGLYLVRQKSNIKPELIYHYGVIDIGNLLGIQPVNRNVPMVVHQVIPAIRADSLADTGSWEQLGRVSDKDLPEAKARIAEALKNPNYDLFGNNCEHFARYVITGVKESHQLQFAVMVALLSVVGYVCLKGKVV